MAPEADNPAEATSPRPDRALIAAARRQADGARGALSGATAAPSPPAASIPGYEILGEIHRGGQGVVYKAVQQNTRRKVAVKVMLQGSFAGERDRIRFEREVQILAQIRDPGVVAVHDSGEADGRFYYVMDYISGQTLDRYVEQHPMRVRDKLVLFARVCRAVNAAHLRGIIHRDLKPSNIRVDADGAPHVLDFGLAKIATGQMFGQAPRPMTMTGQFVGSLPWASPEQAEGVSDRIDVRTDVYSLGVILYQLIADAFPYEVRGSMREVLNRITHEEPRRPSATVKGVRDEVDTITLKALAKDRERRYQTAGELGRDVERFLRGEMIEAKRDSATYVLKKALARNRGIVATGAAFVVLITAFAIAASVLWGLAERRRERAEQQTKLAEGVTRFLNDTTKAAISRRGGVADATVKEVTELRLERLDAELPDDDATRGQVRANAAYLMDSLGSHGLAERHLRTAAEELDRAFGADDERTLNARTMLANALRQQGGRDKLAEASGIAKDVLKRRRATTGDSARDLFSQAADLVNMSRSFEAQTDRRLSELAGGGASDADLASARAAWFAEAEPWYDEAFKLLDEAAALDPRAVPDLERRGIESNRAWFLHRSGRSTDAEPELRRLLADWPNRLERGEVSPVGVARDLKRLADVLLGWRGDHAPPDRIAEGLERLRDSIEVCARHDLYGPAGSNTCKRRLDLANHLTLLNDLDAAERVLVEQLELLRDAAANDPGLDARRLWYAGHLGGFLAEHARRLDDAAALLEDAALGLAGSPDKGLRRAASGFASRRAKLFDPSDPAALSDFMRTFQSRLAPPSPEAGP